SQPTHCSLFPLFYLHCHLPIHHSSTQSHTHTNTHTYTDTLLEGWYEHTHTAQTVCMNIHPEVWYHTHTHTHTQTHTHTHNTHTDSPYSSSIHTHTHPVHNMTAVAHNLLYPL